MHLEEFDIELMLIAKTNPAEAKRELAQEEGLMHRELERIDVRILWSNFMFNALLDRSS